MIDDIRYTLRYFSIFNHPLNRDELFSFLQVKTDHPSFTTALNEMLRSEIIFEKDGFLLLTDDITIVETRMEKETRAIKMAHSARKYAKIIASFPFVRGIALSGSISKLSAKKGDDLDFFIITAANRLWIARTLLHLFKKLTFITGHQHYFCMNYFVAEDELELPHQNEYTAIELMTLIPVYQQSLFERLKGQNQWTRSFLPNHDKSPLLKVEQVHGAMILRRIGEGLFTLLFPRHLNKWLMQLTAYKWKKKYAKLNLDKATYDRAFMTRIHLSKNHPGDNQKRILSQVNSPVSEQPSEALT